MYVTISQLLPCSPCVCMCSCPLLIHLVPCSLKKNCTELVQTEKVWPCTQPMDHREWQLCLFKLVHPEIFLAGCWLVVPYVHMLMHMRQGLNMTFRYSRDVNVIFMHNKLPKVCFATQWIKNGCQISHLKMNVWLLGLMSIYVIFFLFTSAFECAATPPLMHYALIGLI